VAQVTAWRQRPPDVPCTPLSEIAQEFNRYKPAANPTSKDATRSSFSSGGVFDADNPQSLIRSLADRADGRVSLAFDQQGADELVIRSREP